MATEEEHLDQFQHNVSVSERLAAAGDYDWAITVLFYASLHLVQAYLVRCGIFVETHVQRERQMMLRREILPALNPYRTLRDHSEVARYQGRRFSRPEFEAIRDGAFQQVTNQMRSLLEVSS